MPIDIRDYDPAWPGLADHAIAELTAALPGRFDTAEHIGSTAVPGLPAKPVIDLMAATADLAPILAHESALHEIGYQRVDTGMPARLFYRRDGSPAHHLHVVTTESWPTRNERLLRDHLRDHPTDRDQYAQLKRDLAATGDDTRAYTRGKTALIQRLVDAARAHRDLPSVDVWEE